VSKQEPDLRIHAVIKRNRITLGIELMTESLHRRGYRLEQGEAPMKETLAAALLMRAGWPRIMTQDQAVIYDPMCGAGTILIEAVLMAMDIAPGLLREGTLSLWPHHDQDAYQQVRAEAIARRELAKGWNGQALGSDQDLRALGMARRNAERAGVWDFIEFDSCLLTEAKPARKPDLLSGWVKTPRSCSYIRNWENLFALMPWALKPRCSPHARNGENSSACTATDNMRFLTARYRPSC
jgi:23S rRNA (guanine2445-N2)-methyltransferase / 23S rRNA (guanine2069-N7)-methyltransferase